MASRSCIPLVLIICTTIISTHRGPLFAQAQSQAVRNQWLSVQNVARRAVGVAPLTWSSTAYNYALWWAQTLAAAGCPRQHSPDAFSRYGENIAWGPSSFTPSEAAHLWINEEQCYDYASDTCGCGQDKCLHYTQVVWAATKRVGCASAACSSSEIVHVCSYDPPGNSGGRPY